MPNALTFAPRARRPVFRSMALLLIGVWLTAAALAQAPDAPSVTAARLDSVWLQPERDAPASVMPRNTSRLSAEVSGTLLRWTADVGASVARGQLLAQIDPRDAELAVQRAQAALDAAQARAQLAQSQLQRSRELVAQGFFSQEALAQRETELALAQADQSAQRAQLATAQRQLAKTRLTAPFAATVQERLAQTGEAVAPGTVLYVLTESGAAELQASVNPGEAAGLQQASDLRFEAAGQRVPVRLLRISPNVSAPARTQLVRLAFTGDPLPAGTSGTLRWREPRPHIAPSIMVRRGNRLGVFVVRDAAGSTTARFVALPGAQEGRASPVPEALDANTSIVVQGQAMLQDGMAVSVVSSR